MNISQANVREFLASPLPTNTTTRTVAHRTRRNSKKHGNLNKSDRFVFTNETLIMSERECPELINEITWQHLTASDAIVSLHPVLESELSVDGSACITNM
jgi:hypothetical protein